MDRRIFITGAITTALAMTYHRGLRATAESSATGAEFPPINKTRKEWQELLSAQQYRVLFKEGTERPRTSPLNKEEREGTYVCAACYLPLFTSQTKFDSGTGWPSFYQPIAASMGTKRDWKLIVPRTEYHCTRCGGHQGHVFNDGPKPTGQRWCNNGVALRFIPASDSLPALRV